MLLRNYYSKSRYDKWIRVGQHYIIQTADCFIMNQSKDFDFQIFLDSFSYGKIWRNINTNMFRLKRYADYKYQNLNVKH